MSANTSPRDPARTDDAPGRASLLRSSQRRGGFDMAMTDVRRPTPETRRPEGHSDAYEVVIVSYHSRDQLQGLLELVRAEQRVVLVDNASGADRVDELLDGLPHARYIDGGNSGFARAANRGAFSSTAEYVLFASPDTRPSPEIWDALVADLQHDATLGSVAAATLDSEGHIEIGVGGWEPNLWRVLVYAVGLHQVFPCAGIVARPNVGDRIDLGWMTGACLAVRREVFVELGGFDERYFVYNEDMALGRALREAHLGQRLRTDLLVPHSPGASGAGRTKMAQQRGASMGRYLLDHNRPVPTVLMLAALAAGMLGRLVVAAGRGHRGTARLHAAYVKGLLTRRSPFRVDVHLGPTVHSESAATAGRDSRAE